MTRLRTVLGSVAPDRRLVWLAVGWLALGIAAAIWPIWLRAVWLGAGLLLALWAGLDLRRLLRITPPEATRTVPGALSLGVGATVGLRLGNPTSSARTVTVFDAHPVTMATDGLPQTLTIPPDGWAELSYRVRPLARGRWAFRPTELRFGSPGALWTRRVTVGSTDEVRVYPNFAAVARYALLATENRVDPNGIRRQRRRGEGLEFQQLRDYRDGDALRQIDGPASARVQRLISREYREPRDQQILFLLDAGRRMRAQDDDLSHFDHSLNAMLLLGHVAAKQGDAVGLLTFGGDETRWLAPRKGSLTPLLNQVYDLQPTAEASDYLAAATHLMQRQRRRALVILLTNLRDEDGAELQPALQLLRRRHLVLVASLQESVLAPTAPVRDLDDALAVAARHDFLAARRRAHVALRAGGVLLLDVPPQDLAVGLINRYLEIKQSGLL